MAKVSRRFLLGTPLWAALAANAADQKDLGCAAQSDQAPAPLQLPIASGPFQPTADSLKTYEAPQWFRDAKFGI